MSDLSPSAQAVLDAAINVAESPDEIAAAALRAAAEQFFTDWDGMCCAEHLKSIASELEQARLAEMIEWATKSTPAQ